MTEAGANLYQWLCVKSWVGWLYSVLYLLPRFLSYIEKSQVSKL